MTKLHRPDFFISDNVLALLLLVELQQDGSQRLQVVDPLDDAGRLVQRDHRLERKQDFDDRRSGAVLYGAAKWNHKNTGPQKISNALEKRTQHRTQVHEKDLLVFSS